MTSLIKNQILKHLTKFFKDLAPEQLQLSAFKGSCELNNLQLEEKVLMDLLSFPAWIQINKATCDQLSIKIPWTKIKSVPIQMNLNEVLVEVEVCDEFRDISSEDELNLANLINAQPPGKYGFVDRVIDGITVTVNSVLITFKSKLMTATFNLSRVLLESRCPNWKQGELSLTRIKDAIKGQILLFKIVEWQTMRLEAKCLTDTQQAPLRLITNHAQCRLTIKKQLEDCSVLAARIFVIFEDILWVLTFAQFTSAASFVEYIFTLIKRSPMSKKSGLFDDQSSDASQSNTSSSNNSNSFGVSQPAPLISPINTPVHSTQNDKPLLLSGNMSSASLMEQKFLCYDLVETSFHLYIDKVDAHLYDDIEVSSNNRDSGGALQTTLDQIQVDCYPYSRAISDRKHWYRWFDPSPSSRKQWLNSHFAQFDSLQTQKLESNNLTDQLNNSTKKHIPASTNEQLLSLTVLVKIKDYCMNCVATKNSVRGNGLNKFIQTDKDYHMPTDMPSLYLELDYFYYFDSLNRMMIYENVPDPLAFMHLSPTKLLFDPPTLVFLNSFQLNLSKAVVHLNDLFPEETTAPKIHCRIEILMPQISLPAKANPDQQINNTTSALLVKSGKVTLSNAVYDKEVQSKLMTSIEKLRDSPSQPINLGGYQTNSNRKENSCTGDWARVWNASVINKISEFSVQNQLWAIQFEPVWMDFMNYDVDELASGQRLEPIVEPVNAYAFVHLNLSKPLSNASKNNSKPSTSKRDIISILVSVVDGSIMANMDKIQFSFLQRLGMHVEKLLQQIKEDASSIIQLETTVEDSLELNLTAYIKDIKARLILDKKVEMQTITTVVDSNTSKERIETSTILKSQPVDIVDHRSNKFFKLEHGMLSSFEEKAKDDRYIGYLPGEATGVEEEPGSDEILDECTEVADDASCLLLCADVTSTAPSSASLNPTDSNSTASPETTTTTPILRERSHIQEALLVDLDEMEQSSSLFAKVNLKSPTKLIDDQNQKPVSGVHSTKQEIEMESISYLEVSMSQLMLRRITETKRRQKF